MVYKNDKVKRIKGFRKFKDSSYGTVDNEGNVHVNWDLFYKNKNVGEHGFDKRHREANGEYKMLVNLERGFQLIRYGGEDGHYTAPLGEDYDLLSLPYERDSVEFHRYMVIADNVKVFCTVEKGVAAPGFGSEGGGVQFYHKNTIMQCIRNQEIERVAT